MSKYKIKWSDHPDLFEWRCVAEEKHRFYYEYLGRRKWELYEPNELGYLKLKIGYAFFGPPLNMEEKSLDNVYKDPTQIKTIDYIMSAIKKLKPSNVLYIGFTYFIAVVENKYAEFPIVRVLKNRSDGTDNCFFIDPLGYTYKSWEKLLYTNVMPSCIYCYPKNGFYTFDHNDELMLEYSYSPQSYSIFSKGIDVVSAMGSAVTGVLPTGSSELNNLKPIPAESVIKGVLKNTQLCWITVGSFENFSSLYAVHSSRSFIERSLDIKRITNSMASMLQIGSMKTNWFAVLNMMPEILKYANKVNFTHVAQLYVLILFFCHTIVCVDVLKQILKETLNDLSDYSKVELDNKQTSLLQQLKDKLGKKGHEESVKGMKIIKGRDQLLEEIMDGGNNQVTDESGNNKAENLLEELKAVIKTSDQPAILRNYCLFLEEVAKNCKNCCGKIKEAKKYVIFTDDIFEDDKEINHEVPDLESSNIQSDIDDLNNSELENFQDIKNELIRVGDKNKCKIITNNPECDMDGIQPGTLCAFLEFVEDGIMPIEYYNRFVEKKISYIKPKEIYSDQSEDNTWHFVLAEEQVKLKLVKIKVLSLEDNLKCINVTYY